MRVGELEQGVLGGGRHRSIVGAAAGRRQAGRRQAGRRQGSPATTARLAAWIPVAPRDRLGRRVWALFTPYRAAWS